MTSVEKIMDYMVTHRAEPSEPKWFSDILERLVWLLDVESSTAIFTVRDKWLTGDDLARVEIALFMEESFPFDSRDEMARQFSRIAERWPFLAPRCDEILKDWDEIHLAGKGTSK